MLNFRPILSSEPKIRDKNRFFFTYIKRLEKKNRFYYLIYLVL
jgi:hypothetical protein